MHPKEVTIFMEWLEGIYRGLIITRGEVHKYLIMTIYFRTPGELQVTMINYLKGVLEDFPEVIMGRSEIPEANHMFRVRPEYKQALLNK